MKKIFTYCFNGHETWFLTLKEECRMKVTDNKAERTGEKGSTGNWRKLHN
jgi:hypothetical protein